jgi:hypothetical protein
VTPENVIIKSLTTQTRRVLRRDCATLRVSTPGDEVT